MGLERRLRSSLLYFCQLCWMKDELMLGIKTLHWSWVIWTWQDFPIAFHVMSLVPFGTKIQSLNNNELHFYSAFPSAQSALQWFIHSYIGKWSGEHSTPASSPPHSHTNGGKLTPTEPLEAMQGSVSCPRTLRHQLWGSPGSNWVPSGNPSCSNDGISTPEPLSPCDFVD